MEGNLPDKPSPGQKGQQVAGLGESWTGRQSTDSQHGKGKIESPKIRKKSKVGFGLGVAACVCVFVHMQGCSLSGKGKLA